LIKAGFNPDEPRDEHGRWTTGGGSAAPTSSSRSPVKPIDSNHEGFWESLVSRLSDEVQSALAQAGQTELLESEANLTASADEANTIVSDLRAYATYRAQPWIGADGVPVQVPVINTGDPLADIVGQLGYETSVPNAPLMRPATNADWLDPLVNAGSAVTVVVGPVFGAAEAGGTVAADTVEFAADTPFLIPRSEVPADFDYAWPVGGYEIPPGVAPGTDYGNLVHKQIGDLIQDMYPDVKMILRTSPGMKGIDIEIMPDEASRVGFRYAEIKPVSDYGFRSYTGQVARWKLPEPVLAITYDYQGNVYYGFPW
jgi:hypothetical protein